MKYHVKVGPDWYKFPIDAETPEHAVVTWAKMERHDVSDAMYGYDDGQICVYTEEEYQEELDFAEEESERKRRISDSSFAYILASGIDEGPDKMALLPVDNDQSALEEMVKSIHRYYEDDDTTIEEIMGGRSQKGDEIAFMGGDGDSASWFSLFKVRKP